jgi:hypothetical protein
MMASNLFVKLKNHTEKVINEKVTEKWIFDFYVLLPYIIYVMQSRRFSQSPAFVSRTAKERDEKYIVKSP